MTDNNTFSVASIKAAMRRLDGLISDDVIAVSMLFLPDRALEFVDDKGKVIAMGPAMWRALERHAQRDAATTGTNDILAGSLFRSAVGIPVVFDGDGPNWHRAADRIVRSIGAAGDQYAFMEKLRLEAKLLRNDSSDNDVAEKD